MALPLFNWKKVVLMTINRKNSDKIGIEYDE